MLPRAVAALAAALAVAPAAAAADAWPVAGHDAANTSRSAAASAQGPALLPGWPTSALVGRPLVAPDGSVTLPAAEARGRPATAILNPDGTRRGTLPPGPLSAIGPDGRLYVWRTPARPVSAYTAAGDLVWLSSMRALGPEASNGTVVPAPGGSVYASGPDGMVALDPSGAVRWGQSWNVGDGGPLAVGPDGTVYLTLVRLSTPALMARRPDGGVLWERPLGARATRIAVADDGTVIVAAGESVLGFAPDGGERWAPASGPAPPAGVTAEVGGMAVGADGTVYLTRPAVRRAGRAVDPGIVWALGPDGRIRWARRAGLVARGDPIVGGDGTVYVGGRPLVALRPDGSRAWSFPPTSRNLVPQAIGADGTLFATVGPGAAGSAMLALAGPSSRGTAPPPAGRRLVSGLRIRPSRFRMEGPVSVCSAPGRGCRPATPLGATLAFTVRRDSAVQVVIRRAGGGVVTRRAWRAGAGTTWTGLWDAAGYEVLAPGRYVLTVRAAAGATRVTTGPLRFTVAPSVRP